MTRKSMNFGENRDQDSALNEDNNSPSSSSMLERSSYFKVRNLTFPLCPIFHPDPFQSAFAYRPETADVILTSYPKCDTKIIEIILWKLMYPQSGLPELDNITNRYLPCMEMVGLRKALAVTGHYRHHHPHSPQSRPRPRLVKTYLPFHLVPIYTKAKYIYIVRNPWDASVAYHKFLKLIVDDNMDQTFDEFFEKFLTGDLPYGDFFEHVSMWQKYLEHENVLVLSYDVIKANPRGSLFVVAAFLGDRHLDDLVTPNRETDLANVILKLACPDEDLRRTQKQRAAAAWAGAVKAKCSEEQMKLLEQRIRQAFDDSGVEHLWTGLLKKER